MELIINAIHRLLALVILLCDLKLHLMTEYVQIFPDLPLENDSHLKVVHGQGVLNLIVKSLELRLNFINAKYFGEQGEPEALIHLSVANILLVGA